VELHVQRHVSTPVTTARTTTVLRVVTVQKVHSCTTEPVLHNHNVHVNSVPKSTHQDLESDKTVTDAYAHEVDGFALRTFATPCVRSSETISIVLMEKTSTSTESATTFWPAVKVSRTLRLRSVL